MWLKRPVYQGFKGEGKCEGKFLPSHLHSLTFPARSRGDTLPSLRVYCQRALRFLRQGEDERRFPYLLQKTARQEELQVAAPQAERC